MINRRNLTVRARAGLLIGISASALMIATPSMGQNVPASGKQAALPAPEEIIVTARKRDESILKAPVVIQALTSKQLENLHVTNIDQLSSATPGLEINYGFVFAGTQINLRGLGNGGAANFVDQSTSLVIDGAGLSGGPFYRSGLFDVEQIEVLKGPQALFFGKSTSAGLISIRSADPTKTWDAKATVGYEFTGRETDISGYISGPITDKFGIRIAGYHNQSKGWGTNPNPTAAERRFPPEENDGARLSLKYDDPDVGLRVKFKGAVTHDYENVWYSDGQQVMCAGSQAQAAGYAPYDDCKLNSVMAGAPDAKPYNRNADFSAFNTASFANYTPSALYKDGKPYSYTNTATALLDIAYDLPKGLTVTSVSSYGFDKGADAGGEYVTGVTGPLYLAGRDLSAEYSEELRLSSNWKDSWINFMVGALYDTTDRKTYLNLEIPNAGTIPGLGQFGLFTDVNVKFITRNESAFAQVMLTPIEKWELSVGVRRTHVHRFFTSLIANSNYPAFFVPGQPGEAIQGLPESAKSVKQNATTPEATLSYHPTEDITTFVSYKKGFKAPGFNASMTATSFYTNQPNSFSGEKVKGFEGGIKARLFDHQLSLTATGYTYDYTGLQVAFTNLVTNVITISNGANARVQGIELGGDYNPASVSGLTLSAFVNYNDSHYTSFSAAPCYGNETVAEGCIGGNHQNLAGRTLHVAPKVTGTLGVGYKTDLSENYIGGLDLHMKYSSSYYTAPELHPGIGIQKSYALLDAAVHLSRSDDAWDLALICRNCTDKIYATYGLDGGVGSPGVLSDVIVTTNRAREVLLQLSVHPSL